MKVNQNLKDDQNLKAYQNLLDCFIEENRRILGSALTGIYLHGSAVMGCFNAGKSDIDLIVVIREEISDETKLRYMDMVVGLNEQAPAKGIELSVVRESVCRPFVYPTPFELHFSPAHLNWYRSAPEDYVEKMRGTDRDLAAHFTILYHRGKALYGKPVKEVFARVSRACYLDSILNDIRDAETEISEDPMYLTLNLCRVLAYQEESLILSKREGGEWALDHLPESWAGLIRSALLEYETGAPMNFEEGTAAAFAAYMLKRIGNGAVRPSGTA